MSDYVNPSGREGEATGGRMGEEYYWKAPSTCGRSWSDDGSEAVCWFPARDNNGCERVINMFLGIQAR
jgi:hypothetical protein